MDYKQAFFSEKDPGKREILIAFLSEIGFDSFEETETGLSAYIPLSSFDSVAMQDAISKAGFSSYHLKEIPGQNWNEVWEKNFEPVRIGKIHIRAPFHAPDPEAELELIIEPKMSFGTGHHSTTSLMIMEMETIHMKGKEVLDMGCGTSLLAILASRMGASKVTAIDVDDWAVANSIENASRNNITNITVLKGDAALIRALHFDVILANINRNVLLTDLPLYANALHPKGQLLLSGFYVSDEADIRACATGSRLSLISRQSTKEWSVMRFEKSS